MAVMDAGSQGPGDDGEGQDGAAGLQLQGGDETLGGSGRVSLRLQNFAQAVPHVVSRAEDRRGRTEAQALCLPNITKIDFYWLAHISIFVRTFLDIFPQLSALTLPILTSTFKPLHSKSLFTHTHTHTPTC